VLRIERQTFLDLHKRLFRRKLRNMDGYFFPEFGEGQLLLPCLCLLLGFLVLRVGGWGGNRWLLRSALLGRGLFFCVAGQKQERQKGNASSKQASTP
jgi:hypothetical protein